MKFGFILKEFPFKHNSLVSNETLAIGIDLILTTPEIVSVHPLSASIATNSNAFCPTLEYLTDGLLDVEVLIFEPVEDW